MRFLSSLPLLLTLLGVDSATYFTATGTLSCDMHQPWCYYISMVEKDTIGIFDDKIDSSGVHCVSRKDAEYKLAGWQLSDGDVIENRYYEIELNLTHNCSCTQNEKRKIVRPVVSESVYQFRIHYDWSLNVTQDGDVVSEYW
ncbi:hypothetical protein GCK72_022563 [Caenorhabditis remanei]|uniref:Uncharacterized protein n=1 Tax=Caenorhabditis remanei TaxID=31234 RepID=E3N4M4_CAERE|nr:hypothetical protein GCK72_022563 [Caenorhabditis remanei]EFO85567.1 hypothetical protein CRE_29119 [Caenorhabditis remanei]KAF1746111.1 hypothetical protein GCK72_022563 [Caenorhabditis remanei]